MLQHKGYAYLCVYDVKHVSPVSCQSVRYPYVHSGARQSAWPIVYHLKQQNQKRGCMQKSSFYNLYLTYHHAHHNNWTVLKRRL